MSEEPQRGRHRFGERLLADSMTFPAADRNKGPIGDKLTGVLPKSGLILEIASGTGQHVVHFAASFPELTWQPSEPDPDLRAAIRSRIGQFPSENILPPLALDVHETKWPVAVAAGIICINMIHIAPWSATEALFSGASAVVASGGPLVLYGPFMMGGRHTAESNERFDAELRRRNTEWGVRDLDTVAERAGGHGFELQQTLNMPANNLLAVFVARRPPIRDAASPG